MMISRTLCVSVVCCVFGLTQLAALPAAELAKANEGSDRYGLQFDGNESYVSVQNIQFDRLEAITIEAWVRDWSGRICGQGK